MWAGASGGVGQGMSETTKEQLPARQVLAVHLTAVGDLHDSHRGGSVVDLVDHPVVSNPHSPPFTASQLLASLRPWDTSKRQYPGIDKGRCGWGQSDEFSAR